MNEKIGSNLIGKEYNYRLYNCRISENMAFLREKIHGEVQ